MSHIPMSAPQFFPLPGDLRAMACDALRRSGAGLPFEKDGVRITEELVSVALECLNAEFSKTLPILAPAVITDAVPEGLDRCIDNRLNTDGRPLAPVIADLLCRAGIAEKTEVLDRSTRRKVRGVRLLPAWTWHSASVPLKVVMSVTGDGPSLAASWMNLCPVCRTGGLNRVSGKQLFGLPHTEYYIECSSCGAKFVPSGDEFRLVSISSIRDPVWKRNLDKSFTPEIWLAIAHNQNREVPRPGKTPAAPGKPLADPRKTPGETGRTAAPGAGTSVAKKAGTGVFLTLKDGSIAVQCGERTLYFRPVKLVVAGTVKGGQFQFAQKPLQELLETPAYRHLKEEVTAKYPRYLPLRAGLFLWERRERHDPFYRAFLNPYGDEKFGSFRMKDADDAARKGVYLVIAGGEIIHGGCCDDSFGKLVAEYFGRVFSQDCFLDGDSLRCRVNTLLAAKKPEAVIYIHSTDDGEERVRIAEALGVR